VVRTSNTYDPKLCTAPDAPFSSATQEDAFSIQKFLKAPLPVISTPPAEAAFPNSAGWRTVLFSGGVVMRSVHKFGYGHKFGGATAASVVA
jgi:hypothetical protein